MQPRLFFIGQFVCLGFFFATFSSHVEGPSKKCWEKAPKSSANHGVLMPCQLTGILHCERAGKKICHKYFQQIIKSWKKQISVLLRSCCFDRCFKYFFKNFIFLLKLKEVLKPETGPRKKPQKHSALKTSKQNVSLFPLFPNSTI